MFFLTESSTCAKLNLHRMVCLAANLNQPNADIYDIIPSDSQSLIPPESRFTERIKDATLSFIFALPAHNRVDDPSTSDIEYK